MLDVVPHALALLAGGHARTDVAPTSSTEIRTCSNLGRGARPYAARRWSRPTTSTCCGQSCSRLGVRATTSPNPWVGCVLVAADGRWLEGATQPPGGPHAEAAALAAAARRRRRGAPPRTSRSSRAATTAAPRRAPTPWSPPASPGWSSASTTPIPTCAGRGIERLRAAGIEVDGGRRRRRGRRASSRPTSSTATTGRPYVVLKLAASLDGRTAAPDGTSQWITGDAARADAHRLRAESDAVLVGAGTVRADDPALTVRHVDGPRPAPRRARHGAARAPRSTRALELDGDLGDVLDELGRRGVVQVLVEGGPRVAGAFHRAGLVDRYVHLPRARALRRRRRRRAVPGAGAATINDVWRGPDRSVARLGDDPQVVLSGGEGPDPMFTGIVEELGRAPRATGALFRFEAESCW